MITGTIKRGTMVSAVLPTGKVIEGKFLQEYLLQDKIFASIEVDKNHQFGVNIDDVTPLKPSTPRSEKAKEVIAQIEAEIKEIESKLAEVSVKRAVLNRRKIEKLQDRINKWKKFL